MTPPHKGDMPAELRAIVAALVSLRRRGLSWRNCDVVLFEGKRLARAMEAPKCSPRPPGASEAATLDALTWAERFRPHLDIGSPAGRHAARSAHARARKLARG